MNATRYNGPMEKTPALREKRRLDNLEQMIPYLFALGCARTWMTLTFAAPWAGLAVPFDPHVLFDYLYAGFGIAATPIAVAMVVCRNCATFISPMVPATLLGVGLADVDIKDHIKNSFLWVWGFSFICMIVAVLFGIMPL